MEKRDYKKGFTLVELIVVLVILAILAAIMVPALLGWIDKARNQDAILECRNVVQAAQAQVAEEYAKNSNVTNNILTTEMNDEAIKEKILQIASVGGAIGNSSIILDTQFIVTNLKYTTENEITVIYDRKYSPIYRIATEGKYSNDAPGYYERIEGLSDAEKDESQFKDSSGNIKDEYKRFFKNPSETSNKSRLLQAVYYKKYGEFPPVNWDQIKLPDDIVLNKVKDAFWKPIISIEDETILVLNTDMSKKVGGDAAGSIIFYAGRYFYHPNYYGTATDSVYVSDTKFSVNETLLNNPKQWIEIKP